MLDFRETHPFRVGAETMQVRRCIKGMRQVGAGAGGGGSLPSPSSQSGERQRQQCDNVISIMRGQDREGS